METAEDRQLTEMIEEVDWADFDIPPKCVNCPIRVENVRLRDALAAVNELLATLGVERAAPQPDDGSAEPTDPAGPRTWQELVAYAEARESGEKGDVGSRSQDDERDRVAGGRDHDPAHPDSQEPGAGSGQARGRPDETAPGSGEHRGRGDKEWASLPPGGV